MTSSPNLLSTLESFVSLSGSREQSIASNMANVDTPGYHARDIDFDHELKKAMNAGVTNTNFDGTEADFSPATFEVKGLLERPDGNNVDLDREGMMLAQTQLQHQMGISLLKHHFHGLLSAINGGNLTVKIFDALTVSASALSAERQRAEIIAANMANAETTHTEGGGPFHRREVVFHSAASQFKFALASAGRMETPPAGMVQISQIVDDPTPPIMKYEPGHPDADKDGYVAYPAINPATEMVDLMGSVRAYQLNASAVNATKQMIQQSIDILKS